MSEHEKIAEAIADVRQMVEFNRDKMNASHLSRIEADLQEVERRVARLTERRDA